MVLESGSLRVSAAQPSDTGRYTCLSQQRRLLHHVVVVFMPTVSVDYEFVYRVPMCDEMRMSQKASRLLTITREAAWCNIIISVVSVRLMSVRR